MVRQRTKKRPVRQRTKKCPNCGRETVVVDKWSSCQWCHYGPLFKHPPEIEQREFASWRLTWKLLVVYLVVAIISTALIALHSSGWKLSVFEQLVVGHWHIWLLTIFIAFIVLIFVNFVVWYLGTKIRPEFIVAALFIIGILLLALTDKQSIYYEDISKWIGARWDMNFFTASLTVFSLAFAFAGLIRISKTKK